VAITSSLFPQGTNVTGSPLDSASTSVFFDSHEPFAQSHSSLYKESTSLLNEVEAFDAHTSLHAMSKAMIATFEFMFFYLMSRLIYFINTLIFVRHDTPS
jgi:hypothetical protein